MIELAKCPVCGRTMELDFYEGVFGEEETFDCIPCGLTIAGRKRFERISAAMELAECEAWHAEAREAEWWASVRDQATWEDCVKVTGCARVAAQDARARCAEVFK